MSSSFISLNNYYEELEMKVINGTKVNELSKTEILYNAVMCYRAFISF